MEYDNSLIEITRSETGGFAVDASLFVENYWGKEALKEAAPRDDRIEELLSQPFDEGRVKELQDAYSAWLVAVYASTVQEPAAAEAPTTPSEGEVDIELKEEPPIETLGFDEATLGRVLKTQFQIHNTVRGRHNRAQRAAAPVHHRFSQYVTNSQIRLVRSRPVTISGEMLLSHLLQLRRQQAQGVLEVRTLHGQRLIDLNTLDIAASAISPPRPRPPLDSVKRDQNHGIGEFVPPFQGALPVEAPGLSVAPIPPTIERRSAPAAEAMLPPSLPSAHKKAVDEKPKKKSIPR